MDIMEKKQMHNSQLARERAVYDYLESLENGNIDDIIQGLQQAVYDATLDQMLIDAHQAYFQEEQQEERREHGTLASIPAGRNLPALRSFSSHARPEQRNRRDFPMWTRGLAALLLVGVLISSFAALLLWRQAANNATPPPTSSTCTTLKLYPAPAHGHMSDLLSAVTVDAPRDAWAVGYSVGPQVSLTPERTLIEHWNGQRWQIAASPNGKTGNALPENGILNAVAAVSKNDVWAVGSYQARVGGIGVENDNPLIEHWNGSAWQVVPAATSPMSRGPHSPSGNGKLNAISVVSANDIWAAGEAMMSNVKAQPPLLEHWDGKQWSVIPSFQLTGPIVLNGLAVVSARNIWVAGGSSTVQGLLAHWDGSRWKLFTFPEVLSFDHLSASTPDDIWATGTSLATGSSQVEHWDGQRWSVIPLPQFSSTEEYNVYLAGITAVTAGNVWAVGTLRVNGMAEQFLVLHWNGKMWQRVKVQVPHPQTHNPASAIAIGYNQTWIVGNNEGHTALIQGCA